MTLFCSETVFLIHQWDRFAVHVFYFHKSPCLDRKNDLINLVFCSLDFHANGAVPVVSAPAGATVEFGGMTGAVSESDSLDPAIECDVTANHS